jgi:crotonobetainyl-CoA:carnitine CoA-transferase CaiB-like acyl-CoA transferase
MFSKLVANADVVPESSPPDYMESWGIGYSQLSQSNPHLIWISITPSGSPGPYSKYKGSDITVMGMAGLVYVCGDKDWPPVCVTIPQSHLFAGAEAAAATMIALYHREISGEGQFADVSIQQSTSTALMNALQILELNKIVLEREGIFRVRPTTRTSQKTDIRELKTAW